MSRLSELLPEFVKKPLRNVAESTLHAGNARFCPVCGKSSSRFREHGVVPRKDAMCGRCGSLERHRLLWWYLVNKTNLFDGTPKKVLHVAPECCFEPRLKARLGSGYITADLFDPRAMVKMDVTDIKFPEESFDVIYCSHVLEHVSDDRQAMREFRRVLKKTGWAILLVPITVDVTFEDPSIIGPKERLEAFGQEDHVRRYGQDYVARLRDSGFNVEMSKVKDLVGAEDAIRLGLTSAAGEIYFCS